MIGFGRFAPTASPIHPSAVACDDNDTITLDNPDNHSFSGSDSCSQNSDQHKVKIFLEIRSIMSSLILSKITPHNLMPMSFQRNEVIVSILSLVVHSYVRNYDWNGPFDYSK
jgi:hypothetical protein